MKQINLAIIGLGPVVQFCHIPIILKNKKFKISCIVDKDRKILEDTANKFSIKNKFRNIKHLINKHAFYDAILFALNPTNSFEELKYLMKFKKPILLEKPGAISKKKISIILSLSKKKLCPIQVGYMKLYDKTLELLRKKILKNTIHHIHVSSYGGKAFQKKFVKVKKNIKLNNLPQKIKNKEYYFKWLNTHSHALSYLNYIFEDLKVLHIFKYINKIVVLFKSKKNIIQFDSGFIFSKNWNEKINVKLQNNEIELVFAANNTMNKSNKLYRKKNNQIELLKSHKISKTFESQLQSFYNLNKNEKYLIDTKKNAFKVLETAEKIFQYV